MSISRTVLTSARRLSDATAPVTLTAVRPLSTIATEPSKLARRFLPTFSLQDKVCVITGAARGLGNTFAEAFLESGCSKIAILDLNSEAAAKAADDLVEKLVVAGVAEHGEIDAVGYGLDVSNEESVIATMDAVVARWGRIDCLVTSAGIVDNIPALEYPADRMKRLYDINVHGSWFCAREVAKHMISKNTPGSLILVASMSGSVVNVPQPQAPYNASKAAVKQMAKSFAVEWADHGIRVNSLSPGYMRTPLVAAVLKGTELEAGWIEKTPMKRLGTPEDLKGAIVLLASDASKFVTGSDITVDGGYTAI